MMQVKTLKVIAAFAAIYVIWGSTYLALTVALQALPPFLLMASRSLVGGGVLLSFALASGRQHAAFPTLAAAALSGLLFFVGGHGLLAYAQQYIASGLAALLIATVPVFVALLNGLFPGRERNPPFTPLMLAGGLGGVAIVAWGELHLDATAGRLSAMLLALVGAASWALATIISERQRHSTSPAFFAGLQLIAGGLGLLVVSVVTNEQAKFSVARLSAAPLAGWLYLTIAGTIVTFAAYIWLLRRYPPTIVSTYTFVNPIIALALGWLVLGETISSWALVGAPLIILSVSSLIVARHIDAHRTEKTTEEYDDGQVPDRR